MTAFGPNTDMQMGLKSAARTADNGSEADLKTPQTMCGRHIHQTTKKDDRKSRLL